MALLPEVDVFLPNEVEALSMARISVVEDAIARLRSAGAGTVVVKTAGAGRGGGAGGRAVAVARDPDPGRRLHRRRRFVRRGLPRGVPRREPLRRCLEIGNACGALSTRGIGGTSTQPTMVEALEAIERGSVP